MPDLTPEQAIEKLRTLPEDRQRAILGKLSPEQKKSILGKLKATPAKATATAEPTFSSDPKAFLEKRASDLGAEAQGLMNVATGPESLPKVTPRYLKGKLVGYDTAPAPSALKRYGAAVLSGIPAAGQVVTKAVSGLLDPKAAAAVAAGAIDPAIPAAYFATQGTAELTGITPGVEPGNVSPENVQNALLAGATIAGGAGAAVEPAAGAVTRVPKTVGELRAAALEKVRGGARAVTQATHGAKEAVTRAGEQHVQDILKNKEDRATTRRANVDREIKARSEFEKSKSEHTAKTEAAEAEKQRKSGLEKQVDEQSVALGKKVEQVEASVAKEANRKFDAVREKIGNPEAPADDLIASVKSAETNILQGIPEQIKEFRSILGKGAEEAPTLYAGGQEIKPGDPQYETIKEAYKQEGILEEGKPVTWDYLQSIKSRIDDRLRKGRGMNGDLKRSLRSVRESTIDEMGKMAEAKAAAAEWGEAKNFWRQYKEDFHEPTGPSGSGSPVASALDAVDPKNIRAPFIRTQATTGNRGVEILRKYGEHGGNEAASLAEDLLSAHAERTGIKVAGVKPFTKVLEIPKHKPLPEVPEKPTVDIEQAARKKIAENAQRMGRLNAWDARVIAGSAIAMIVSPFFGLERGIEAGAGFVITKELLANMLDKPKVVNWIARTPPGELIALRKLPEAQQVNIKSALTEAAIDAKATTVSPQLREFLGPANVQRILTGAAATPPGGRPPTNRREAMQLLGK